MPNILDGTWVTIQITVCSIVFAFAFAFVLGLGRLSRSVAVRGASYALVEVIRGTSLMVQLFWLYFVLPFFGIKLDAMITGIAAIGLNIGAYGSEVVRSSVLAVPKGQTEAAIALNMTPFQRMTRIIIPQALMRMIPPFGNLCIELLKSTSLVSFITLADLTYETMTLRNYYHSQMDVLLILLLVIYFVLAYCMTLGIRLIEKKLTAGRM